MSTETDDETIMQAWFGSPKKIFITIAGFLSMGLVAFTFIGGNSSSTAVEQQTSSRVDEATVAEQAAAKSNKAAERVSVGTYDLLMGDMKNVVKATLKYEGKIVTITDAMSTGIGMNGTSSGTLELEDGRIVCEVRNKKELITLSEAGRALSNVEGNFSRISGQRFILDPCRLICQFPNCPG